MAACGHTNPPHRRFCAACGARLPGQACRRCGFWNGGEDRYCGGCGGALGEEARATRVTPAEDDQTVLPRGELEALLRELLEATRGDA